MTPTNRRAALAAVGWSIRELASESGWHHTTCLLWFQDGGEAPAWVDAWLERALRFYGPRRVRERGWLLAHPVPGKGHKPTP